MADFVDSRVQHVRRVCEKMVLDLRAIFTDMRAAVAELTNEVQFVHQLPPVPQGSSPVRLLLPVPLSADQIRRSAFQLSELLARAPGRIHVIRDWTRHFNNTEQFDMRGGWLTLKRITRVTGEEVDRFVHTIAPFWEQVARVGDYMDRVEESTIPMYEELVWAWGQRAELSVLSHEGSCLCVDACGMVPGRILSDGSHTHPMVLPFF